MKRPIQLEISDFLSRVALKFDGWHFKNNKAPLLCHVKLCAISDSKLDLKSPEMPNAGKNRRFFVVCDLEIP